MKLATYIYKTRKKNLLMVLGAMYILTLIAFGIAYWKIANISSGEFFIFQNDINMDTKISVFKKKMKINIYNRDFNNVVGKLIASEEYKRPIVKIRVDKEKNMYSFAFDEPLGEDWANYYYLMLQGRGITHMKIEKAEEQIINRRIPTYKLDISLYRISQKDENENYIVYEEENKRLKKSSVITIWVKGYPTIYEELFKAEDCFYPLNFYFINLMENSISFLDDSPLALKNVANGSFKYPLWNFMYFSAVTITTLGYGDILPNSTMVRMLVMIETIFGAVIIGMFASCLFWNRK